MHLVESNRRIERYGKLLSQYNGEDSGQEENLSLRHLPQHSANNIRKTSIEPHSNGILAQSKHLHADDLVPVLSTR